MSMTASFVQVDAGELAGLQANPSLAEELFQDGPGMAGTMPPVFLALAQTMQDRMRAGPQAMAGALSRLDPSLRRQIEESMGRTAKAFAGGAGGDDILKRMQERNARAARPASAASPRAVLSLEKAWHGVHYVLSGTVEPGAGLLSQAVLGGVPLGDDDEGFSGYGPARYFTVTQVGRLSEALSRPELESEATARFDATRMSELGIYPGWRPSDAAWVMDHLRGLRDFYAAAASQGRAIVTCLV